MKIKYHSMTRKLTLFYLAVIFQQSAGLFSTPTHYFAADGDTIAVVQPHSGMDNSWGIHNPTRTVSYDSEISVPTGGPNDDGEYCHRVSLLYGSSNVTIALGTQSFWLHTWANHSCQSELQAWSDHAALVREHEFGHRDANDDWTSESLLVEAPAKGRAQHLLDSYGLIGSSVGDTPAEAEDDAESKFDVLWDAFEQVIIAEHNLIHAQYHSRVGGETEPDRSKTCD
ncbi:hypothetical protein QEH59_17385 [Coraliomargarita sp. SDUM461004]|uniref:DUF922 domain-containing protein n=1 Tax=Thalassobacterium sedimentorum TaxID=3041258 RepID=A0ABU1AN39_9BACT|nr:hypothetical protein [Coraliomargarita sp. SDUM461004]MDQ8196211.1 hypothetical protein [Coraliomargarita sp. SDUM461004]